MERAIILFTRVPVPGKTKTRMMPYLTEKQCAALHTCFLRDIEEICRKCKADVFVSFAPEEGGEEKLKRILGEQAGYFPQEGEGLGARMYHALGKVFGLGYKACLLIGSDVPEVSLEALDRAYSVLEEKDVVFGRTMDGGYYLTGMKSLRAEAFGLKEYGHGSVLCGTVQRLTEAGISVGYTDTFADMDTPSDLNGYRRRMRGNARLKGSHTGRCLARNVKISVIVPVYNEVKTIEKLQKQLLPLLGKCEILLVDGGSTDGTLEKILPEIPVLRCSKGRARQMNHGARKSSGDVLFFLHCDSELPKRPLEEIRRVMRDFQAGCFGVAFHSCNFFMLTCRLISNHRIKDRKVMFGDQGIFLDRALFFEAGMYPEIPVMEDYQLSLALKERGVKLGMCRKRIYTSDRRFPKGTIRKLALMWKMNRLRKMYRDGVPAAKISRLYEDVR